MKQIAVFGIGRSSHYLLEYLNRKATANGWRILACDLDLLSVSEKIVGMAAVSAQRIDTSDTEKLRGIISASDIVVSLLPPALHFSIAQQCLDLGKHLATASYVSDEMRTLHAAAKEKELVFINEIGLDPGIDHLSALKVIHELKNAGADITSFESYCGGLILLDDCGENPWAYKFSWNPMNVVLAGQGGMSVFKKDGRDRFIPWHRLFAEHEKLKVDGYGVYDAYANRDSLSYMLPYGLESATTFMRGTLRREHFCTAWQVLVTLGFTDNITPLSQNLDTPNAFTVALTGKEEQEKFSGWLLRNRHIGADLTEHFDFLNMESTSSTQPLTAPTAAGKLLQHLSGKWKLEPGDRDEVVMVHRFGYMLNGNAHNRESKMRLTGIDSQHTAMAKTVGLPLAMAVEAVLNGEIKEHGVLAPISPVWYKLLLPQLAAEGIYFEESQF